MDDLVSNINMALNGQVSSPQSSTPDQPAQAQVQQQSSAKLPPFDPNKSYGTPSNILDGLTQTENSGKQYGINKQTKAMGPYQFTPETLQSLHQQGVKFDPFDPVQARNAADYYLQSIAAKNGGDMDKALGSYGGFITKDPSGYIASVKSKGNAQSGSGGGGGQQTQQPQPSNASGDFNAATVINGMDSGAEDGAHPADSASNTQPKNTQTNSGSMIGPGSAAYSLLQGAKDSMLDAPAQLLKHALPDSVGNAFDSADRWLGQNVNSHFMPIDQVVQKANQDIGAGRDSAGKQGFDWTRLAGAITGAAASPLNKLIPGGTATGLTGKLVVNGLKGAAGAAMFSPVDAPGNFAGVKAGQTIAGGVGGSLLGTLADYVAPYISKGIGAVRNAISNDGVPSATAANNIVSQAMQAKGIDEAAVEPTFLDGLRKEVASSIDSGKAPDFRSVANVAEAKSLPVPIQLLKGQASRDPMQFALEQNLSGLGNDEEPIGRPITDILSSQNKSLIDNLNTMGAHAAPSPVDTGATVINAVRTVDAQAKSDVSAAYNAFKQSTGRDLDVPLQGIAQDYSNVKDNFGDLIPSAVKSKFDGLVGGLNQTKTFTINDAEGLIKTINLNYDPKNLAQARALNALRGSVESAITDGTKDVTLGAEAAQLARNARSMATNRFDLINAVPAYKAALPEIDTAPDKFVSKFILGGNARDVGALKQILQEADPGALDDLKASVLGVIKDKTLSGASDENGKFSQSIYNKMIGDPNMHARLSALFEPDEMQSLEKLGSVAENILSFPHAAGVNTSKTASAASNIIQSTKLGGLGTQALRMAGNAQVPIVSPLARGAAEKAAASNLSSIVNSSIKPLSPSTSIGSTPISSFMLRAPSSAGAAAGNVIKR